MKRLFACLAEVNHIAYDVAAMRAGTAKTTVGTVAWAVAVAKFVRMTPTGNHRPHGPVKRFILGDPTRDPPMGLNPLWE